MTSLGFVVLIRAINSLASRSPAVMAPASMAASRRSSRRLAFLAALSGPWQAKQFSARIGRTSRLYSSLPAGACRPAHKQSQGVEYQAGIHDATRRAARGRAEACGGGREAYGMGSSALSHDTNRRTLAMGRSIRQRATPVRHSRSDMAGHRANGAGPIAGQ